MKYLIQCLLGSLLLIFVCIPVESPAQTWHNLPNSPQAAWRHDDLFFINGDTGWVVNVDGYIYKTTDGGNSWMTQLFQPTTSFRCVGFANALHGWAGNLGTGSWSPTTDTLPLYETTNGGTTWNAVQNISGPIPAGICGISVVNDSVVYAVGRVGGPGHILKTTDAGQLWTSVPVPSPMFYLIDAKFFSPDTGIVVGCTGTTNFERYAVFHTTDGGQNWQQVHGTNDFQGICWKISFPTRQIGYVSVEAWPGMDSIPVLKTTDGGITWTEKLYSVLPSWNQGIGFLNDSTGYCGANQGSIRRTTDGGDTWNLWNLFPINFNRFRKVNDSVAYASGFTIWKYSHVPVDLEPQQIPVQGLRIDPNYPNPFSSTTTISYHLPFDGDVDLRVYDWTGRPVKVLVHEWQSAGKHMATLALPFIRDAHFYYSLRFGGQILTGRALMIGKD